MHKRATHRGLWILGGILLLVLAGGMALQLGVARLKAHIAAALGPQGEVRELRVGLGSLDILGLRLPAPAAVGRDAWPTADLLRAERIQVVPSLADLFHARLVLRSVRIENAELSLLRSRDGRLLILPGVSGETADAGRRDEAAAGEKSAAPAVEIGRIEIVDSRIAFFDAAIRQPPLPIILENITARLEDVRFPALDGHSSVHLEGRLKGVRRDGQLRIDGWATPGQHTADIGIALRDVELIGLQPYLLRAAETGVRQGRMDLDLQAKIDRGRLHAPGRLVLRQLELAEGRSFMGVPRSAVLAVMRDRKGEIVLRFVLDGQLDDPAFSLKENFMTRITSGLAESLGISLEGLVKGVGSAGGSMARGLERLFGK